MSICGLRQNSMTSEHRKMDLYSSQLVTILMNTIGFICSCVLFTILESGIIPSHKIGFFCNDKSISYPRKEETISTEMLIIINAIVSITIIVIYEHATTFENDVLTIYSKRHQHWLPRLCAANHLWPIRATKVSLLLVWYIMANGILTDVIKITVGSLRPHFMAVCNPNITCSIGEMQYNSEYTCQEATPTEENYARMSFPSGHASMSATVMGFIVVYVQYRCKSPKGFILLKPIMHITMVILATWISMTRVSDYYHHLIDVICGFLQGTIIGMLGGLHATKGEEMLFDVHEEITESDVLIEKNGGTTNHESQNSNKNSSHQHEGISGDKAHINASEKCEDQS